MIGNCCIPDISRRGFISNGSIVATSTNQLFHCSLHGKNSKSSQITQRRLTFWENGLIKTPIVEEMEFRAAAPSQPDSEFWLPRAPIRMEIGRGHAPEVAWEWAR
jgi:hypothetical protein